MSLPALVSSWCPLFERGPALRRLALMFGDERYLVAVGRYFFFLPTATTLGWAAYVTTPPVFVPRVSFTVTCGRRSMTLQTGFWGPLWETSRST